MSEPTFDLYMLRTFVLGIELGSFATAADRVGRSTSAVSAQLKVLEAQVGVPIVRKEGRGLVPTAAGEILLGYARRLLALNDEASGALRGLDLDGAVRIGLQEDFGEHLLPEVLGRFAETHPRVRVEARVARNADLLEGVRLGALDLALAWDSGTATAHQSLLGLLPLRWIAGPAFRSPTAGPLGLAVLDAPCLLRNLGTQALDQAGMSWRVSFTSQGLGGVWAAVRAGLGVTVRTSAGLPPDLRIVDGLPGLPSLGLVLHQAEAEPGPLVRALKEILELSIRRSWTG